MSEGALCLYNQKGYCKFKDKCRKPHENKTCPEDTNCRQKECPYRHPKVWRNFSKKNCVGSVKNVLINIKLK